MTLTNTLKSYGGVAKSLHWLTALLILTLLPLGWIADQAAERATAGGAGAEEIARAAWLFSAHKTLGIALFGVALLRILWALTQKRPGLLNADHRAEALAAETVHWLLYGALVLVPLSGWIHHAATEGFAPIWWPFGQSLPMVPKSAALAELTAVLHRAFLLVLLGALALHVAGALKHHLIDHDATLRRMLPGRIDLPTPPKQAHSATPLLLALMVWLGALGAGTWVNSQSTPHAPSGLQSAALQAVASDWQMSEGTLAISVTQLGSAVSGSFADWSAAIQYDPRETPGPAGEVTVTIAIPSLALGSVTAQAMGADFFDAAQFPTADFTATLHRTETGHEARGMLNLRGASVPVTLPFDLELDGDTARMHGTVTLDRRDFGIGANMPDESSLKFPVTVDVSLTASR
ncbi:cytochrome b/b6 domain-containing protein [Ruegeria pomeroyi]|nr:cytochrome b/b6 domain-containing protein [Ruegeria pomeroyi]